MTNKGADTLAGLVQRCVPLRATRAQTSRRVTGPGVLRRSLTGAALAVSRGAGEVAAALLAQPWRASATAGCTTPR
jgi:ABC-type sulfate transport system permease component